jgi:phosphoribosylcarboxyaminoimidazole (NCAIR) mutase
MLANEDRALGKKLQAFRERQTQKVLESQSELEKTV